MTMTRVSDVAIYARAQLVWVSRCFSVAVVLPFSANPYIPSLVGRRGDWRSRDCVRRIKEGCRLSYLPKRMDEEERRTK